jgi:1-acyl-sn-glycerol-3-phosphate acyltransferase
VALSATLPVVPVTIVGSGHVMRKGRLMVCPGEVLVKVHDPVPTRDVRREDVHALAERVRTAVAAAQVR